MDIFKRKLDRFLSYDDGELLNVTRWLVRFLGIWCETRSILGLRIACTLSLSAYALIGTLSFFYPTGDDIITYGITLTMLTFSFLTISKAFWLFYNSKKIGWLLNELERITIKNIYENKSHEEEFIKAANTPKIRTLLLYGLMSVVFVIETLYCLFISSSENRMLFNLYSFIDPTRHYLLALAFQYFYSLWSIPIFTVTFNLLMSFTLLTVANLSVLESHLRSAPTNLSRSVTLHTDIISITKVVNEVLGPAITSEMTMGTILTCVCAYMCVESKTLQEKGVSYTLLCSELAVFWFICHYGTILEEKSKALTDAVYSSPWIELKPKQRKEIITLMIATNKPLQIKLSRTHIINYAYFSSFIQLSYSFLTFLLNMDSE